MKRKANLNEVALHDTKVPLKQRILYAPLGVLFHCFSLLPLRLLYGFGDLLGFIAYYIVRYRRRVVRINLSASFPQFSKKQLVKTERRFYRRLGGYFVETLKMLTMSDKQMMRRMVFKDTELVDKYLDEGRDIVIYTSHFCNWEWITSMGLWCKNRDNAIFSHVYRPLRNKWFNRWWLNLRGRFNVSIPMKHTLRRLFTWRKENQLWITGFLSDQKPGKSGKQIEVNFLNRPTSVICGTEELARKFDAVVMLFDTEPLGRGYYQSTIRLITDDLKAVPEGEVTRLYVENLQRQIERCPEAYLWSHNRWRIPRKK